jgi:uncharacterized protein HemY
MNNHLANTIIITGLVIIACGIGMKFISSWHLPGDIVIERKNFSFYFPITTCIIISIMLSLLLPFILKLLRK